VVESVISAIEKVWMLKVFKSESRQMLLSGIASFSSADEDSWPSPADEPSPPDPIPPQIKVLHPSVPEASCSPALMDADFNVKRFQDQAFTEEIHFSDVDDCFDMG
jgi:hypothetical protein